VLAVDSPSWSSLRAERDHVVVFAVPSRLRGTTNREIRFCQDLIEEARLCASECITAQRQFLQESRLAKLVGGKHFVLIFGEQTDTCEQPVCGIE
jgi:hypothetical protein